MLPSWKRVTTTNFSSTTGETPGPQMKTASQNLEFEKAALLRDQILEMRRAMIEDDDTPQWERIRQYERQAR